MAWALRLLAPFIVTLVVASASGQTEWKGVSNNFNSAANWTNGELPTPTLAALIAFHGGVSSINVSAAIAIGDLTIGDLTAVDPVAFVLSGSTLTFSKTGGNALVKQGSALDVINNSLVLTTSLNVNVAEGSGGLELKGAIGAGTLTKTGGGKLVISGVTNNALNLLTVQQGTVLLAKGSTGVVHAVTGSITVGGATIVDSGVLQIGGTAAGPGVGYLPNFRDQIAMAATVTLNAFGRLDLNGLSEGIGQLLGTGVVTNSVADTLSVVAIGEGSSAVYTFGGVVENGAGQVSMIKAGSGTATFTGSNTFTGDAVLASGILALGGANGSLATQTIKILRGTLLLDNTVNNNQDRISNTATVMLGEGAVGGGLIIRRNGTAGVNTQEKIGTLSVQNGHNVVRFDHSAGANTVGILANVITLEMDNYTRGVGGTVAFTELATPIASTTAAAGTPATPPTGYAYFSTTDPAGANTLSKIILNNLPTEWLVGGAGTTAYNKKVLVGAFGNTEDNALTGRFGNRLMTVQTVNGVNYIRPLDKAEFRELGGGASTNTISASNLLGGSPSSSPDDNVRITGAPGSVSAPLKIKIGPVDNQLAGHLAFNSWWQETEVQKAVSSTSSEVRIAEYNVIHLGGFEGDELHNATTSGSGTMLFNGGVVFPITPGSAETASTNSRYAAALFKGGTLDFGSREAIIYVDVTNTAQFYSRITGTGGFTKTGLGQAHIFGWNTYSGITTHAANELWLYTDGALGQNGAGNEVVSYGSFLIGNGTNIGSLTDPNLTRDFTFKAGTFFTFGGRSNSWNGDIFLNNVTEAGELGSLVFDIRASANLIVNGDITGRGEANASIYTANTVGRTVTIYNEGTNATSVRAQNGIFRLNGQLSDYEGRAALETHEKLSLRFAGYSVSTVLTHNKFNAFLEDATRTNPYLEMTSGYLHINQGLGVDNTTFTNTVIRQTDGTATLDRANTISAILLGQAGAAYRTSIFTYGASAASAAGYVSYSSNSTALLGGENSTGKVTFGNSNGTSTFTFAMNSTQDNKAKAASWTNLAAVKATSGSGGFAITLANTDSISIGMLVEGGGVPAGARVADISGNTIYLNVALTGTVAANLSFYSLTNKVTLADVTNLQVGMGISGTGIRPGTVITAINAATNEITLSTTLSGAVPATALNFTVPKTVNIAALSLNKIQNYGEVRLYQNAGGTSEFITSFTDGAGYRADGALGALTKVGRGTTILSGGATSSDINGGVNVFGGALVFNYAGKAEGFSHVSGLVANQTNPYQLTLGGGELRLSNEGASGTTNTENLRGVFTLRAGNSTVTLDPGQDKTLALNLGLDNPHTRLVSVGGLGNSVRNPSWYWRAPDRFAGATVNFFADTTVKGSANFYYSQNAPNGAAVGGDTLGASTIIPYSTFKYRNESGTTFVDFASFLSENGNTRIVDAAGYVANSPNLYSANSGGGAASVSSWNNYLSDGSNGYFTDDGFGGTLGFSGVLEANAAPVTFADFLGVRAIRFAAGVDSTITLGTGVSNVRLVLGTQSIGSFDGDGVAAPDGGAILVSNSTGAHNQRITGGYLTSAHLSSYFTAAVPASSMDAVPDFTSRDLIIHNYNTLGTFTIDSTIVDYTENHDDGTGWENISKLNLVIAGPGTTHLTQLNNFYTGLTYVSGGGMDSATGAPEVGTLWAQSLSSLGTGGIYLNGGRLRLAHNDTPTTTSLGAMTLGSSRPLILGGNGGYIELTNAGTTLTISGVVRSEDNILSGNVASNQMSANPAVGDLIKEGAGKLILTNNTAIPSTFATTPNSAQAWNAYYGLTIVKQGTLQVNIGSVVDSGILGSNDSTIDGTIVEQGARLDLMMTATAAGTKEWITLDGGTLGTTSTHTDGVIDGVINVTDKGGSIDVGGSGILRFNVAEGYLTGSGNLVKTGTGILFLYQNNVDYKGNWDIQAGLVIGFSQGMPFGTGNSITLGSLTATTGEAGLYLYARDTFTTRYQVSQDIVVRANAGAQVRNIGARPVGSGRNQDSFVFDGDITLNGDARFTFQEGNTSASLVPVAGELQSSQVTGSYRNLIYNGHISGTGNIGTDVKITGAGAYGAKVTFLINGNNSSDNGQTAWTGSLSAGNVGALNNLQEHFVRMGHNRALTAANNVSLGYNVAFQLGGKSVTIGDLKALQTGNASTNKTVVENAANDVGTLTVTQSTNADWDVLFQDGTTPEWYSAATATVYSNRLNLTKSGSATAVLTQLNTYTGITTVDAGNLQVGKGGNGTRANANTVGRTGTGGVKVNNGGILSGTGVVQAVAGVVHEINAGGKLAPGDLGGASRGTLFVDGTLRLNAGGTIELQITTATHNFSGLADVTNTSVYSAALLALPGAVELSGTIADAKHDHLEINGQMDLSGGGTISILNDGYVGSAGDVFNLIDWSSVNSAGFSAGGTYRTGGELGSNLLLPTLSNGLAWDTSLFASHGILVVTNVPEPGRVVLVLGGLVALALRRRRRA